MDRWLMEVILAWLESSLEGYVCVGVCVCVRR